MNTPETARLHREHTDQARDNRRSESQTPLEMKTKIHSPSKANHEAGIDIEAAQLSVSIGRDRSIIGHIDPDMHMRCATEVPNK